MVATMAVSNALMNEAEIRAERVRVQKEYETKTAQLPNWDTKKQLRTREDAESMFAYIKALDAAGGGIYPSQKQIQAANRILGRK